MERRRFLGIMGSTLVLGAAGSGIYAATRSPAKALAPWSIPVDHFEDPRLRALSRAILAPNPHNRQPWLIELSGVDELTLYCDPGRLLLETDPFGRQIVIGLGCFLELLRMAAAEDGVRVETIPFPDGEPGELPDDRPVARVRFAQSVTAPPDPLFQHVLMRRSNKTPFNTERPVHADVLTALRGMAVESVKIEVTSDLNRVDDLRDLTWRAHLIETRAPAKYRESIDLMRLGKAEINANPDGINIGGPALDPMITTGLLSREKLSDPNSDAFQYGLDMYRDIIFSAMAYVWVVTSGNSRADQLNAGRVWVRLNLAATALGVGLHPLSQALQEYPEMSGLHDEVHGMLEIGSGNRIQMLGRLGYGSAVGPSPRWPLETRIREA